MEPWTHGGLLAVGMQMGKALPPRLACLRTPALCIDALLYRL